MGQMDRMGDEVFVFGVGMTHFEKPGSWDWNGAGIALQHDLGLGGACVVTMYRKADLA
jgi:hypothetical protein